MYTANNQIGVTLVEMVATLAIISILATGILPLSQVVYKRTREMELRNDLRVIRKALDEHKFLVDEKVIPVGPGASGYPESLEILVTGIDLKTATSEKRKFLTRGSKWPRVQDG